MADMRKYKLSYIKKAFFDGQQTRIFQNTI